MESKIQRQATEEAIEGARIIGEMTGPIDWKEVFGRLYTVTEVANKLLFPETLVHKLRQEGIILLLNLEEEGGFVAPAFQFKEDGDIDPLVPLVRCVFKEADLSDLATASWFVTPQDELDGKKPVELFSDEVSRTNVYTAALHTAARASH